jgi:hypothetical protein
MDRNLDGSKPKTKLLFEVLPITCPTKVRYEELVAGSYGASLK